MKNETNPYVEILIENNIFYITMFNVKYLKGCVLCDIKYDKNYRISMYGCHFTLCDQHMDFIDL